jgi:hypothetical protein
VSKVSSIADAVMFCLLSTASFLVMEIYAVARPGAAGARLDSLRRWMDNHRSQVIVVLSVAVGLWLIGKSAYTLAR